MEVYRAAMRRASRIFTDGGEVSSLTLWSPFTAGRLLS
jgi:hypothetical protein